MNGISSYTFSFMYLFYTYIHVLKYRKDNTLLSDLLAHVYRKYTHGVTTLNISPHID